MDTAIVVASISSLVALASMTSTYRASSKANKVTEQQTKDQAKIADQASAIRWIEELREDNAEARKEAAAAREEATATHRQMVRVRKDMEVLAVRLHDIILLIHRPGMNMERLRMLVPVDNGGTNGNGYSNSQP